MKTEYPLSLSAADLAFLFGLCGTYLRSSLHPDNEQICIGIAVKIMAEILPGKPEDEYRAMVLGSLWGIQ